MSDRILEMRAAGHACTVIARVLKLDLGDVEDACYKVGLGVRVAGRVDALDLLLDAETSARCWERVDTRRKELGWTKTRLAEAAGLWLQDIVSYAKGHRQMRARRYVTLMERMGIEDSWPLLPTGSKSP